MATSAAEGRDWIYERIRRSTTEAIVDVGPGEGTYSILGRHLRLDAKWYAVEIYTPYIERYHLEQKYDHVYPIGVEEYPGPEEDTYLILFGDVIEHLPYDRAVRLLEFFKKDATEIMVSIPIIESIQGTVDGNCHEAHLHQWTFEEMEKLLPGCESWRGATVGRFWWRR